MLSYRNQEWLENLLADIWYRHFEDVEQTNDVVVIWAKRAKRRLGSIELDKSDGKTSVIKVNRLFQNLEIPEYVIRATIVHEMTHYAHGFASPHRQRQRHPHSGGVVRREFAERGLADLYIKQQRWLRQNWQDFLRRQGML
jgi:hypothetical protein